MTIVAISGGFDPLHVGHVRMIEEAARHGNVMVFLNTDDWLIRKKGYAFMPFGERAEILMAMKGVVTVVPAQDEDGSVCESIRTFLKPGDIFANGGDRTAQNTPELKTCQDLRVGTLWGIGGDKVQSSSSLVKRAIDD